MYGLRKGFVAMNTVLVALVAMTKYTTKAT